MSTRTAVLSVALSVFVTPRTARAWHTQDITSTCSSGQLALVADSVAAVFDTHQFVFLGSTHGGKKSHDFLLCLLSRPGFQRRVTDVLVEWANPVHQTLVDRSLLSLEPVPEDSLRRVWFDTDAPELWARLPLIPQFYAAVRAINTRLEPARRIRVLGGCEPIDWSTVKSTSDVASYPFKNNWAAHVIAEHFARHPERRLLVVYGDGHINHNGGPMMADLESKLDRGRLFVVGTIGSLDSADVERVAGLGDRTRPLLLSARQLPSAGPYPRDLFYAGDDPLAAHVDAVAYLGPEADQDLSNATTLTQEERAELARRDALKGDLRRLMQLRFGRRDRWFRSHPNDIPARPWRGRATH